ncbi:MAG: hypothetical protein AAF543_05245 [Pseudomonadota bacterium]
MAEEVEGRGAGFAFRDGSRANVRCAFRRAKANKSCTRRPKKRVVTAKPGKIELLVDGVTLRVPADIDETQLTRTIRAIRAA